MQMHRASAQGLCSASADDPVIAAPHRASHQTARNRAPHLVRLLWHADIAVHEQLVMVDVLLHSAVHELEGIQ